MKTAIRRVGKLYGVIVPKSILSQIGAQPDDAFEIHVENGKLVISMIDRDPRPGWAKECEVLAEAGEDGLIWPEFGKRARIQLV